MSTLVNGIHDTVRLVFRMYCASCGYLCHGSYTERTLKVGLECSSNSSNDGEFNGQETEGEAAGDLRY